jgi:hypothetical protein
LERDTFRMQISIIACAILLGYEVNSLVGILSGGGHNQIILQDLFLRKFQ